jgi:hypothetical protein
VKSLENERNAKRRSLFDAQDEIDSKREKLILSIRVRCKSCFLLNGGLNEKEYDGF